MQGRLEMIVEPRTVLVRCLVAGIAGLIAGCGPSAEEPSGAVVSPDTGASAPVGAIPALRARLRLESLRDGRNADQDDYEEAIGICEQAGFPIKALTGEQVARLGTAVVELMSDGERRLSRQTRWVRRSGASPDGMCLFEFEEVVSERYMDARTSGWSDGDGTGWQEVPISPEDFHARPVDAGEDAAIARELGWTHLGPSEVAGQPCEKWTNAREEVCLWSGGLAAGYSNAPSGQAGCFSTSFERFEAAIPLQAEPVDGTGCRIRVDSIEVGEGTLPAADMIPVTK